MFPSEPRRAMLWCWDKTFLPAEVIGRPGSRYLILSVLLSRESFVTPTIPVARRVGAPVFSCVTAGSQVA